MKIDSKYIEETLKLIFEGISGVFAFFGFMVFIFILTFADRDSLIVITSDPEIRSTVQQESKTSTIEGSHLMFDFQRKKNESNSSKRWLSLG